MPISWLNTRHLSGYEGLACALFRQAVKDARSSNGHRADALAFLSGPWAAELLETLGGAMAIDLTTEDLGELCQRLRRAA